MVKVIFSFDVPEEKQAEFLKLSREGTKPYWEAHGALSYDVWQTEEGSPGFVKELLVKDVAAAQGIFARAETDPEAKALVERWEGLTVGLTRKLYVLKT
jgi:quinol monooxygenase YgiN